MSLSDGSYRAVTLLRQALLNGASLSPDGRHLAYAIPAGAGETQHDIFVVAVDGSGESSAVQGPADDLFPIWSHDGTSVLFLSNRTRTPSLWSVEMRDGRPSAPPILVKPDIGDVRPLGLSEQGTLFYYRSGRSRQNVHMVTLDGMQATAAPVVTSERFVNANSGPSWSRDGQYLAYYSFRPQPFLVVRAASSGEERDVALEAEVLSPYYAGPKWFPDSRSVLTLRQEPGSTAVGFYRRRWDVAEETLLHEIDVFPGAYDLSPDGRTIFYIRSDAGAGPGFGMLVAVDIASGRATTLRKDERLLAVAVSPDGREVAYLKWIRDADRPGSPSVVEIIPASGGPARQVFRDDPWLSGARFNTLAWFPDGRHLMFVRDDGLLWRVPNAGGPATPMGVAMDARIKSPAVHPDGSPLAFGTVDADDNDVWLLENFGGGRK
jgi:Tol biopolymer transport system component